VCGVAEKCGELLDESFGLSLGEEVDRFVQRDFDNHFYREVGDRYTSTGAVFQSSPLFGEIVEGLFVGTVCGEPKLASELLVIVLQRNAGTEVGLDADDPRKSGAGGIEVRVVLCVGTNAALGGEKSPTRLAGTAERTEAG